MTVQPLIIQPIKRKINKGEIYNNIATYYNRYIPTETDFKLSYLVGYVLEYLKTGNCLTDIKRIMSRDIDIDVFLTTGPEETIDFGGDPEHNGRLSSMLSKIIALRLKVYEKSYYIAQDIIEGKTISPIITNDLNIALNALNMHPIDEFYGYLFPSASDESVEKFYDGMDSLTFASDILDGKSIPEATLAYIEKRLKIAGKKTAN